MLGRRYRLLPAPPTFPPSPPFLGYPRARPLASLGGTSENSTGKVSARKGAGVGASRASLAGGSAGG